MRRSPFQWKKGFFSEKGEAIQWMRGLVRISTGKAIQWRGWGHSLNRRTLKIEKLLSSSPSRKSALSLGELCAFNNANLGVVCPTLLLSSNSLLSVVHELIKVADEPLDVSNRAIRRFRRFRQNPLIQGGPGSVRFGYGLGMERFKRFRFSVLAFLCKKGLLCFSTV